MATNTQLRLLEVMNALGGMTGNRQASIERNEIADQFGALAIVGQGTGGP